MNPLVRLGELGQSPWYDYITRELVASGELARLIREDGLRGMTSNPTIFEKAVAGSGSYDEDIRRLSREGRSPGEIFEALAVADVRAACDEFAELHRRTGGLDGQVSLKIPAETQSGRVFRLRDKGVKPVRGGARGDLFCRVVVETPVKLSSEQKDLLRKFADSLKSGSASHSPREEGFFEGVKRFFTGAEG